MLKIYITNLGKYNEGELIGEWLELPYLDGELEELLEKIGINKEYEEYFITDYEGDLNIDVGKYANISQLNDDIEELSSLEDDMNIINGLIDNISDDLQEIISILRNGNCSVLRNVKNYTDVGKAILEELDQIELPSYLSNCFNYDQYGRESDYILIDGDMAISIH